jgi:hypothetical protein
MNNVTKILKYVNKTFSKHGYTSCQQVGVILKNSCFAEITTSGVKVPKIPVGFSSGLYKNNGFSIDVVVKYSEIYVTCNHLEFSFSVKYMDKFVLKDFVVIDPKCNDLQELGQFITNLIIQKAIQSVEIS